MAEDAGNPNQLFDNYAKEFSLRIDLLRAVGEYEEKSANAKLTLAKALDQLEGTRTIALVNGALRRALREIEIAEHHADVEREAAQRRATQLQYVVSGSKPQALATFYQRLEAISWVAGHGDGAVLFVAVPESGRFAENYFSLSQLHPETEDLPDHVLNVATLLDWMRSTLHYPRTGSEAHWLLSDTVTKLAGTQAKIVADLEARLDLARKGSYEKMHEVKAFLGLSPSQ